MSENSDQCFFCLLFRKCLPCIAVLNGWCYVLYIMVSSVSIHGVEYTSLIIMFASLEAHANAFSGPNSTMSSSAYTVDCFFYSAAHLYSRQIFFSSCHDVNHLATIKSCKNIHIPLKFSFKSRFIFEHYSRILTIQCTSH